MDFVAIGNWCIQKFEASHAGNVENEIIVMLYVIGVLIFESKAILQRLTNGKSKRHRVQESPTIEVTLEETVMNGDLAVRGLQVALNSTLPLAKEACITFLTFFTKVYLNKTIRANV